MKLASVLAAIAIAAQAAHATNAVNTTNAVPDVAVDAPSDGEPELSYPDEDCPNPKKVPHCCAHVRFRNKVARAHNCHASQFCRAPPSPLTVPLGLHLHLTPLFWSRPKVSGRGTDDGTEIVVKQPGSLEGVGTACARTSGWMALCCKPNPVCYSPLKQDDSGVKKGGEGTCGYVANRYLAALA